MKKSCTTAPQSSAAGIDSEALFKAVHDAAEADSLTLCHINNVVALAAFACDARRTLVGINDAVQFDPAIQEVLADRVVAIMNWTQFDDVVGDVLQNVSTQIQALSKVIGDRPFDLRKMSDGDA